MTREQIENLEQSGAYIEHMFHTLASIESSTYEIFLSELDEDNFSSICSSITNDDLDEYESNGELPHLLIDYSMYGFIAEIRMPERLNFNFREDGSFQSCSVHPGIMRVEYVFAPTIDALVEKAIKIGNDFKKEQEDKARLKNAKLKTKID